MSEPVPIKRVVITVRWPPTRLGKFEFLAHRMSVGNLLPRTSITWMVGDGQRDALFGFEFETEFLEPHL